MRQMLFAVLITVAAVWALEWQPEVRLTENNYSDYSFWSTQRRVAVDPQGRVHCVWYVMNSALGTYRFQVYYKRFYPGQGWTQDTMISFDLYNRNLNCKYPSLAIDSSGVVYAVWAAGGTDDADEYIYIKSCVPGGSGNDGWEESSRLISVSAPAVEKGCPTVASGPDGNIQVTWLEGVNIVHRERRDTVWLEPRVVEGGTNYKAYPAVAVGPDNRVHLVWYGREGVSGYYDVFYKVRTDTVWGATENVSQANRHQMYPSIAVNPVTGNPHILWQSYGTDNHRRIVHRFRTGAGWQLADTVSGTGDTLNQEPGQIVFTRNGMGYALWTGKSESSLVVVQVRCAERAVNGVWGHAYDVTRATNTRERPAVAAGNGGAPDDIVAIWTDYRDGNAEMYFASASPAQFIQEGVRFEPKTVPATLVSRNWSGFKGQLFDPLGRKVGQLKPGLYFLKNGADCYRLVVVK
ncbi:MAG: hypothetical protein K6T77_01890 [candidate division WOR-3 bacterium]|nr:hypothetical protein [candidate division WOR-3 bacterium]MCR4424165.1 hypothetical protein [candidate division WOR-3 bacterium]MDH7519416.1 hypothetical protein [bacterium]